MKKIIALLCFLVVFSLQIKTIHATEAENSFYNNSLLNEVGIGVAWTPSV